MNISILKCKFVNLGCNISLELNTLPQQPRNRIVTQDPTFSNQFPQLGGVCIT